MSIECVECGSRVHGCFPCGNCGCELPPVLTGQDAEIDTLKNALRKIYKIPIEPAHCYKQSLRMQKIAGVALGIERIGDE